MEGTKSRLQNFDRCFTCMFRDFCKSIKSKISKILNSEENQIEKSLIMAKSNDKTHKKRMDNNCHIPDLV